MALHSSITHEIRGISDPLLTIIFEGLWCAADKKGRLEDRPLRLKAEILPYRENIDFNGYLTELSRLEFILRYEFDGQKIIQVINFLKHQNPHHTEKNSTLPEYDVNSDRCKLTVNYTLDDQKITEPPLLIPDSRFLIPDSKNKRIVEKKSFSPPSVKEVAEYCQERNNSIDATRFIDHYTANGWMVGKNKMKCWKASIRTWEQNGNSKSFVTSQDYGISKGIE